MARLDWADASEFSFARNSIEIFRFDSLFLSLLFFDFTLFFFFKILFVFLPQILERSRGRKIDLSDFLNFTIKLP